MRRKRPSVSSFSMESFPNKSAGSVFINAASGGGVAPVFTVAPQISGTAVVDQTLTCDGGTVTGTPTPTKTYQWYRGATLISGATNSTYTLVQADAGQNIKCTVGATNSAGIANADSNTLAILATLLDLYPNAATAYGPRLLRGAHLNLPIYRIRRSSDNAEVDVFVDNNYAFSLNSNINSRNSGTTIGTWIGANNGFISIRYDQSGNAINAIQATPSNQIQVINAGALYTLNGKARLRFNASFDVSTSNLFTGYDHSAIFVCAKDVGNRGGIIANSSSVQYRLRYDTIFVSAIQTNVGSYNPSYGFSDNGSDKLMFFTFSNTETRYTVNNVDGVAVIPSGTSLAFIPNRTGNYSNNLLSGLVGDQILWASNNLANKSQIINEVNTYYGAY